MQDLIEKHLAALDRAPADEVPFRELENLFSGASRWDDLLKLYEQRARLFPDAPAAPQLWARAGDLVRTRLNNLARAEELYQRALVARRNEPAALEGLQVVYESKGDLVGLAAVLERRAQETPGTGAAAVWLALGAVHEKLGRRDRAVLAWQRAVRSDPKCRDGYARAFDALCALGRWALALQVADQMKAALGKKGMAERYLAVAERLKDNPPEHALALRAAVAAQSLEPKNEQAAAARSAIEAYKSTWQERVRSLRLEANEERDRKRMAQLFLSVALCHATFDAGDDGRKKAREFIDRALLLWPGMPAALDALEQLSNASADFKGLAAALEKLAGDTRERTSQAEIYVRLATLRVIKLGDREGALAALLKAAQIDPSRADAVGLAVDFLLDESHTQEAAALLDKHLATLNERRAQVALRLRLAELLETRLSDRAGALAHLEAALQAEPTCLEAARRLVPLYEAAGERAKLAQVLELALQAETEPAARLSGLVRLGELYGEGLARPVDALHAFARALLLAPHKPELRAWLEKYAGAAGKWDEAVRALRLAAGIATGPAALELLKRAAELSDDPLGKLDEAKELWGRVLELAPQDELARAAVESLLSRTGAHEQLVQGYEAQLAAATAAPERREILVKMAHALEQSGDDPRGAMAAYRRILEIAPDDRDALKKLGAACAALGEWDEVAQVTAHLARVAATPEEAREWRLRRAQVLADRLSRKEEAGEEFLAILAEDPARPGVLAALEKIAAGGVLARRIAEATLPHFTAAGDHVKASQALQTLAIGTDVPAQKLPLLRQLAALLEGKLADQRGAFGWLEQALRLAPADAELRAEAERLAQGLSAQAELAALLMELSEKAAAAPLKLELLLRAAQIAEAGAQFDLAIQAADLAAALPEGAVEGARMLQRIAIRAERWSDCERALKLRLAREAEKAPLLVDLARVCDRQARPAEAAAALEQALAAGASEADLLPHLSRLYEAARDARGQENAFGRELALAEKSGDREKSARLRLKMSKLQEKGDRSKAVANYSAVLAERPSDPEALAALEKMLQSPELRESAARALAPAYEATKEARKLVFALEILSESIEEPAQKVAMLKRIAQIHSADLRHPPLAFATLARALRISPTDPQLRVATRKAAEDSESLDAYAEILGEAAHSAPGEKAIPLFRELAEVSERKLGNREQAIAFLARILEIEPENIDGLRGLHRLYRLAERWPELAEICRRLAKVIYDDQERTVLFREAGVLFEGTLKRPDEAAACFRALAEVDPLDRDAALALDRLYTALQRPQDLAFALELRRAQEGSNAAGCEAAFRLAELKRNVLNDPTGALQVYGQILAEDPGHANARAALEAWARSGGPGSAEATALIDPALERAGEHARRVGLREAAMAQAPAPEKARLVAEIRKIYERDMGRPELAFMAVCRAFSEAIDREHVGPELERLARETGSWEELADVYEKVAEQAKQGDEMGLYCLRRAAQLRAHLGEAERAIGLWKDLLGEVPGDHEALEALAKLHEKGQNARELSEIYKQQAALAQDPATRAAIQLQAGQAKLAAGEDEAAVELGRAALVLTPKSRGALELLDRAYDRLGRDHEHADVLKLLADVSEDPQARRAILLRRAQLLEKEGELSEAVEGYAKVLAENAGEAAAVAGLERLFQKEQARPQVARVLEPFYRSVDDARHLADVLEVRASQSTKEERLSVYLEIARLREALGQRPMAFAVTLRCFRDVPHDEKIRVELERLAAETGHFEELAAAYEDELEHEKDEAVQLELWRRLGAIYGERLGEPQRAAAAWEEVYRRAPGDGVVLETLSNIYRRTSALRELVAVLWRQVALCTEPARKRELLVELAQICEEKLTDRDSAVAAWREIRKLKEDDSQALAALPRLLTECGRFDELAELLQWRSVQAEKQGKAEESLELLVALGRLKLTKLADPRGGLAIFQDVVTRRPGHAGAVAAMEEMARSEGGLKAEAAMALEPVFAQGGDYLKLVQMLEARSQTAPPVEKAMLLRRVAELYAGPLVSVEMAFVFATRALEAAPDDPDSLAAVLTHARPAGAEEECAALLAEIVEKARTDEARAAIQRARARLLSTMGAEPAQVIAAYKRLLELSPGDTEALDGLAAFFRDSGAWTELLEVLRRQLVAAAEPEKRAELLKRMGEVQDERMGDHAGAIATFRRFLELAPDDVAALERLDRLCQTEERWAELADVLAKEIALAEKKGRAEQALSLKFRLAQVREQRLLDRSGAMALYREVLALRPGHEETVARLEIVVGKEPGYDEAAELLSEAYRTVNNHGKLAKLLEDRAGAATDGTARKRFLGELARIRTQHLERSDLAFLALCKAFREDPGDAAVRESLEHTADAAETHEELAALYEEEMPRLDGAAAAQVCLKLAQLNEQKLNDPELAINYYEKARAADPAVSRAALPALDRLYKEAEDWGKLAEVLAGLVALADEPAERTALLFRLGQLAEEKVTPPSPDRAARAYEQILDIDPNHLPAARALEKLYETAKRHDRLYTILELQQKLVTGPEKERITARMAEVAANGLKDVERAIALYNEVLTLNPRSDAAFLALEGLYEDTQQNQTLGELLTRRLAITVDPREITRLSDKLGRVQAVLGNNQEAIGAFRAALERDPRHRKALDSLRVIYEQYAPSEDLAGVLRRMIPLQDDAESVKKVRLRLAEVLAALGKREEAVEAARRVLDVEPHKAEDLLRAEELFRSLNAFNDQIRAMEPRAELAREAGDVPAATSVLYSVAEVYTNALKKREAAAPTYEHLLEIAPGERMAFDALREIYAAQVDWRKYAGACERFLPGAQSSEERVEILKDLGTVQEQKLGHKDLAFLSFCRAFSEAPVDEEVRQAMHRLAEETGSFEELATVYEDIVDTVEKGPQAEKLYTALAKIHDEKLDQPEEAEANLRKVLEFDPANRAALEALAQMFARRGRDSEYVVSLEQKYEAAASIEERKAILHEIAVTYDSRLNKPEEAAAAFLRALELEPDRDTFRTLADLYRRDKKWLQVAELLMRARDYETEPQERARLQVEVSELYEREIGDDEAAVAGYQLSLEFDPANLLALSALERLYTKLDRPAELLGVYDAQLKVAEPRDRVKILFKTASIWEDKYQNLENADACLEAVLAVEPSNLAAIKGLERLRRLDAEKKRPNPARWEDLLRAYERHLSLGPDLAEQVELLVAAGEVYYKELKRIDRAAQIFHQALELNPRSREAMHALGLLYERSGNWPFALDMLAREAELLGGSKEAVELFHRIGKINEEMLLDTAAAKQSYQRALMLDAGYLPSLRSLKGLHELEKDWDNYLQVMIQEATHTVDVDERAHAWLDVAHFYQDSREDRDNASRYYEEALKLIPDSMEAARPLADIYVAREEWEGAERMLDIVAKNLSEGAARDPQVGLDLCRQMYRLGYVCEKLKKSERALGAYERAYQLDSTYLPSAEGYANLLVASGKNSDALSVYQAILIHHREDLTDLEVVEYYWQVGDLYRKLGSPERAKKEFDKALAIDQNHEPSLRSEIELAEQLSDWEGALDFRGRLAGLVDEDTRFELYVAIGKIAKDKLSDPYRAIDAYVLALELEGGSAEVHDALLALYRETRQANKAVEVGEKMLALPEVNADVAKARKLWFALGEVCRDELKDVPRAAEAFNKALDLDFRFIQAFSALEAVLGQARQWDALEQNYVRMIQRLPKGEDTHAARMSLWRTLGDFYEKVKKDRKATKAAYQVVVKGLPDDVAALEKYAELAGDEDGSEKEAIEAWRKALISTEHPQKVVNQLVRLSAKIKDYDGAYVAAQVAAHLVGEVGADEREILAKLTPYARRREQASKQLTGNLWTSLVYHPKVRGPMGDILALVYDKLGSFYAKKHSAFGIDPRTDLIDLDSSLELAVQTYKYVVKVLDMESMPLFAPFLIHTRERLKQKGAGLTIPPDKDLLLEVQHTHPVSLKAGGKLFGEQPQKELYFFLGKTLAFARPELALARLLPAEKLDAVFQAAVLTGVPSFRPTADPRAIEAELRVMERIEPQFKGALSRLGREYARGASGTDVRNFVEGAELTANRVGALLATDLEAVKNALGKDTGAAAKLPLRARIRDLVIFCLSKEFAELRGALGLKIEIKLTAGR